MNLYKYMSEKRIKDILIGNKIRFTQPIFFNDPFEIKLAMKGFSENKELSEVFDNSFNDTIKKEYENLDVKIKSKIDFSTFLSLSNMKKENCKKIFIEKMNSEENHLIFKNKFDEYINKIIGILSLTKKNDNLLMWAHYANEHKGFVVEFDRKNKFFESKEKDNFIYKGIQKVTYSSVREYNFLVDNSWDEILLTKSKEWEYENEYRIIRRLLESDERKGNVFLFKFSKNLIKSIYCGCNMEDGNKQEIIKIIKEDKELNHIKVFEMKTSDKYYKLDPIQIL